MVAMSVFLAVLPLILSLEGTRALLLRLKLDHVLPKASKWAGIGWFWVMGPATLITLIFGVLTVGNSGNMRTAHGVSTLSPTTGNTLRFIGVQKRKDKKANIVPRNRSSAS